MSTLSHAIRRRLWDNEVDLNPPSMRRDVVKLMHIPHRSRRMKRLEFTVTLDETKRKGEPNMRCLFTTELKVDIDATDDALRKAFIDLVLKSAREVYGIAGMLAKGSPMMAVKVTDRHGEQTLPMFAAPVQDIDDDE